MIGTRIPSAKRLANGVAPLDPNDMTEANALNIMFLMDLLADGEYLQDMSILQRHLSQLAGHEQNTPNLTVRVEAGTAWYGLNSYVTFAGGNSPAIAAPSANPRRDIVTLRSDGNLYVLSGAEAASPVAPAIPSTDVSICQVYCRVGMTKIRDNDTQEAGEGYIEYDLRPLFQRPLGSDAMPKIGIVGRVQATSTTSGTLQTVLNYPGAGRLRLGGAITNGLGAFFRKLKIVADGVTLIDSTADLGPGAAKIIIRRVTGYADRILDLGADTGTYTFLDILFKNSLVVQHAGDDDLGTVTTTIEYERE